MENVIWGIRPARTQYPTLEEQKGEWIADVNFGFEY
jgi:hypothetical protein